MAHEGLSKEKHRLEIENTLSVISKKHHEFTYRDSSDSQKSRLAKCIYIYVDSKKIGQVWDPRESEKCYAVIYSDYLTDSEKQNAIDVYSRKYQFATDGSRKWNRHVNDMSDKYNIRIISKNELINQIESLIDVYLNY